MDQNIDSLLEEAGNPLTPKARLQELIDTPGLDGGVAEALRANPACRNLAPTSKTGAKAAV